jgi:hypothetical protein
MSFTARNHCVPKWYPWRFLRPGESNLWYLNLKPDVINLPNGKPVRRKDGTIVTRDALRHLGPVNCFMQDHVYQ